MVRPQARPRYYRNDPRKAVVLEAQMRAEGWQGIKIAHYWEPIPPAPAYEASEPRSAPRRRERRARAHARRGPPEDDVANPGPLPARGRLEVAR